MFFLKRGRGGEREGEMIREKSGFWFVYEEGMRGI
jgi:hypothetical protein